MDLSRLADDLRDDEGLRLSPYQDSRGVWTVGYGFNLEDNEIPLDVAELLLTKKIAVAVEDAKALYPSFHALTPIRQEVLVNMAYNMGRPRLAGFSKMSTALAAEEWDRAADEMLDSMWAEQVGPRADRLAERMRSG